MKSRGKIPPPDTSPTRQNGRVPVTKLRNFRVDEYLWVLAGLVAKRRRETLTQVIKTALVEYVERHATDEERRQADDQC